MLNSLQAGRGYNGTFEYEPIGADIARIPIGLPAACLVSNPNLVLGSNNVDGDLIWDSSRGSCDKTFAAAQNSGPEHLRISGAVPHSGFLILRQLTYPAWQVKLNGQPVSLKFTRDDGLITVPVAPGQFELTVDWAVTRDVVIARWLSALSVFALTCICLFERSARGARKTEATSVII